MNQIRRKISFKNKQGLHIKPAAAVAKLARSFEAEITICKDENRADVRSIFELLILGVMHGDPLEISAVGHDAEAAVDAISEFLHSHTDTWMPRDSAAGPGLDCSAA